MCLGNCSLSYSMMNLLYVTPFSHGYLEVGGDGSINIICSALGCDEMLFSSL